MLPSLADLNANHTAACTGKNKDHYFKTDPATVQTLSVRQHSVTVCAELTTGFM
jgi:hypothetical protein